MKLNLIQTTTNRAEVGEVGVVEDAAQIPYDGPVLHELFPALHERCCHGVAPAHVRAHLNLNVVTLRHRSQHRHAPRV